MDAVCLRKSAALLLIWTLVLQQVSAGPVVSVGGSLSLDRPQSQVQVQSQVQSQVRTLKALRRSARMTPLWRILNSKPFGAYCQNNYECSTGLCRGGFCALMHRTATASATN